MKPLSLIGILAFLASLTCTGQSANATQFTTSTTLDQLLIPGNSILCGNKLFDGFSYSATAAMPTPDQITVTCITISGNHGIRIQGGFIDPTNNGTAEDALIGYTVTTQGFAIIDNHLAGNPFVIGGDGVLSVVETILDLGIQKEIHDIVVGGVHDTVLSSSLTFAPQTQLHILKDIIAFNQGGVPTLSFVDQTFSQVVPEPASVALLGIGGLGSLWFGRRRLLKP